MCEIVLDWLPMLQLTVTATTQLVVSVFLSSAPFPGWLHSIAITFITPWRLASLVILNDIRAIVNRIGAIVIAAAVLTLIKKAIAPFLSSLGVLAVW